jgi:hypothetical protein
MCLPVVVEKTHGWCLCIRDSRNFDLQRFSPESWRRGPRAGRH